MSKVIEWVRRARYAVLALCAALCLAALAMLPRLQIETDFLNFLPKSDADLAFFKEIGETFGGNYVCMVTVQAEEIFTEETLTRLRAVTRAFKNIEGVDQVMSITNMLDIRGTDEGIAVVDLLPADAIPSDPTALASLREYVLSKEMYTQAFVSKSGTTAAIVVRLAADANVEEVARTLRKLTTQHWGTGAVYFAGFPMIMEYLMQVIWRDMSVLTFLVAAAILLVLFLCFRAPRGVILPLVTVALATLFAFGAMGVSGNPITLISAILPVVLFSTGTAYTIHLLTAVDPEYREDDSRWSAIGRAISKVGVAILLSGVTTLIGFLSLMASPLSLFVDFGIYAALGVGFALAISLTVVPVMVSFLKPRTPPPRRQSRSTDLSWIMDRFAGLVFDARYLLLLIGVISVAGASVGIFSLRTELDVLGFFARDSEPAKAEALFKKEFGGSTPMSVHVRAKMKDPRVLTELLRMQKHLRAIDGVNNPASIADLIAEMNEKLNGRHSIPGTPEGVASLWLLMEGKEALEQLVTKAEDRAMIEGRIADLEVSSRDRTVEAIDALIERELRRELIFLPWADLPPQSRDKLAQQAVAEMVQNIELDLAARNLTLREPDRVRTLLLARVGRPLPAPALDRRRNLALAYFSSDDCDVEIADDGMVAALADATSQVAAPEPDAFLTAIKAAAPALIEEDEEGVEIAAETLQRLLDGAAQGDSIASLYTEVATRIEPPGAEVSARLEQELRGDLWASVDGAWLVTPERFAALTGRAPAEEQVGSIELRQTGMPVMQKKLSEQLRRSQVVSLGFALVTVFFLLIIQLRSIAGGLISIVPIVFTLAVNFGLMGLMGITVNPATMMIAALAIGIGIDYTIHIITRLRNEMRAAESERDALVETLRTSGKAVIINVLSVAAGFVVIAASKLVILQQFGLLIALSMLLSAFGALTLIPALVLILKPRFMYTK